MAIIDNDAPERRRVGLIYDDRMCKHADPVDNDHPENPNRIRAIWDKLNTSGLAQRCIVINGKEAKDRHLALVHSKEHIELITTISSKDSSTMSYTAAEFDSIYFNEGSSEASYLAAGSVIEAAEKVAKGELDSAFAIVRPPGHHAEEAKPMGFCLYNNIAVAASFLLNKRPKLGVSKILIVDWDVHHGNGTQKMFYNDRRVLFFSVHRHDFGKFYPYGNDGSHNMIGEGEGKGYNINVPWKNGGCGDADYFSVWDHILIPVAKEFDPDLIMISAGFDAALGDPLGGCCLTPYAYSVMLRKLMKFARGKIVMALEGGYNLVSLANSALACVEVLLLDEPLLIRSLENRLLKSTGHVIRAVRQALSPYWPVLASKLTNKVINSRPSQTEVRQELSTYRPVLASEAADEAINSRQSQTEVIADPFTASEQANSAVEHVVHTAEKKNAPSGSGSQAGKGRNLKSGSSHPRPDFSIRDCKDIGLMKDACRAIVFPADRQHYGDLEPETRNELALQKVAEAFTVLGSTSPMKQSSLRDAFLVEQKKSLELKNEVDKLKEHLAICESGRVAALDELNRVNDENKLWMGTQASLEEENKRLKNALDELNRVNDEKKLWMGTRASLEEENKRLKKELEKSSIDLVEVRKEMKLRFDEGVCQGFKIFPNSPAGWELIQHFVPRFLDRLWKSTRFTNKASLLSLVFFKKAVEFCQNQVDAAGLSIVFDCDNLAENLPRNEFPGFEGNWNENPKLAFWNAEYQKLLLDLNARKHGASTSAAGLVYASDSEHVPSTQPVEQAEELREEGRTRERRWKRRS